MAFYLATHDNRVVICMNIDEKFTMDNWNSTGSHKTDLSVAQHSIPGRMDMGLWWDPERGGFIFQMIDGQHVWNRFMQVDYDQAREKFNVMQREYAACIVTGEPFGFAELFGE